MPSLLQSIIHSYPMPPPPHSNFIHSDADGWRDQPGFNSYLLQAAFPALMVEHQIGMIE